MEFATLISEALFAGAQSTEVLNSLGDYIIVQLEVDAAGFG
jgi:hypothetical protein